MKKGFTLIELLATIIILALIGLIVYPTLNNVISNNRNRLYEKQISELKRLSNTWIMNKGEDFNLEEGDYYLLKFDELAEAGLIQNKDIKNPKNSENLPGCMVLTRTEINYEIEYSENCKKEYNCTTDKELVQGLEFVKGQYTYHYMQKFDYNRWQNITADGWGVVLTDKNSTDPVDTPICTTINGKPIISMSYMFYNSQATSIDLSSFDTSNVTDMSNMFGMSVSESLNLSNFDTSNVINMSRMFWLSNAVEIDLSSFDTSNVGNMSEMFTGLKVSELILTNFNTSKVGSMRYMFSSSQATTLDLSSFDTSNVSDMRGMFSGSKATKIIGLNNFDTSNVCDMVDMFSGTQVATLDLSSFDTSNVWNMGWMFGQTQLTSLDLSSFDTSNVSDMTQMFTGSTKLSEIKFGEKFNTSNVQSMREMFCGVQMDSLGLSNFDTSNVTNMSMMFYGAGIGNLNVSNFNTSNVNDMSSMFAWGGFSLLDLSSFEIHDDANIDYMFSGASATTGYARTQADADRLNASKENNVTFVVK